MPVIARLLLEFRNAEIDHFGPKLIVHDFCGGSLSKLSPEFDTSRLRAAFPVRNGVFKAKSRPFSHVN
jgi:hypothetical protein